MLRLVAARAQSGTRKFLFVLAMGAVSCGRPDPLPGLPRVMLWAWERPERMTFLDARAAGVAFLAGTVSWHGGRVEARPRYQPLEVPPGTAMAAVVRLESGAGPMPDAGEVAAEVLRAAALPRVRALQIDFDARRSEREWYGELVRRVRRGMKTEMPLTITALASWCGSDSWITELPVADAVPMLFRMGAGEQRDVREFAAGVCRSSLGVSTDEPLYAAPHGRRVWVFHPRAWTPEAYRAAMQIAGRWR
ncbi:MAG TPA: hypothetical protein VMH28_11325 [Candidatus Acidoferrales bacterium]|nr:hypothetical protein [Candidatus Acidoferrales bacterium]